MERYLKVIRIQRATVPGPNCAETRRTGIGVADNARQYDTQSVVSDGPRSEETAPAGCSSLAGMKFSRYGAEGVRRNFKLIAFSNTCSVGTLCDIIFSCLLSINPGFHARLNNSKLQRLRSQKVGESHQGQLCKVVSYSKINKQLLQLHSYRWNKPRVSCSSLCAEHKTVSRIVPIKSRTAPALDCSALCV